MKATIAIAWLFLVHECKIKSNMCSKSICTIQTADPENSLRMIVDCPENLLWPRSSVQVAERFISADTQALFPLFLAGLVCCFDFLSS